MMATAEAETDGLEVLSEFQCAAYLQSASLGRIAFRSGDNIEILPVNYAADGTMVVFRTASGTVLEGSLAGPVAFEVDGWEAGQGVGWSVLLKGVAGEITDGIEPFRAALRELLVVPLAPGTRERWIAVYPSEVTGRRFRRS